MLYRCVRHACVYVYIYLGPKEGVQLYVFRVHFKLWTGDGESRFFFFDSYPICIIGYRTARIRRGSRQLGNIKRAYYMYRVIEL